MHNNDHVCRWHISHNLDSRKFTMPKCHRVVGYGPSLAVVAPGNPQCKAITACAGDSSVAVAGACWTAGCGGGARAVACRPRPWSVATRFVGRWSRAPVCRRPRSRAVVFRRVQRWMAVGGPTVAALGHGGPASGGALVALVAWRPGSRAVTPGRGCGCPEAPQV